MIALIVLIAGFYLGFAWANKPEVATARFAKRVKKNISAAVLQNWATNYLSAASENPTNKLDLPEPVLRISSKHQPQASIGRRVSGVKYLDLMCGGGFGHWGLAVGSPDFVMYEGRELHVLEWEPGIYFWREK